MWFRPLFIFFALFFSFSINAQDWTLPFSSKVEKDDGNPCQGATISLLQSGKQIAQQITGPDGAFKFEIPPNGDFLITVTKQGHVLKKFTISTRGVPDTKVKGAFKGFVIQSIVLFEPLPGIDYSVLNQPLVNVTYRASKDNFDYDEAYSKQMLGALERLRQLEADALAKKQELEASYKAAIAGGDKTFLKNDWAAAKTFYTQATTLKPAELYPKDQLKQIDKNIADLEALNKKKAEDAKKAAEEAAKKKADEDLNNKYIAALKKGDDAFAKKDWPNAKVGYNEALVAKPAEQLPKDKLALVDKAIADAAKADADAKSKAELEAKYTAALKKGDEAISKKDWPIAKAAFTEAIALKSAEQYPKDKLILVDKAIADAAAAKAKADADAAAAKSKAELDAKYLAAVKKGDDGFAAKNWTVAKDGFTEATGLKPTEQYPKDKLVLVDKAIADEAAAKAKAEADAKSKVELDAKYLAAIKKGDDAFAKKDWATAKGGYTEAGGLKPAEQFPKTQLAAIEKAIAEEIAAKAKADADAKSKAELDAKYLASVKKGDDAFAAKDWITSKAGYTEASGLKPAEQYPKTQIALIDKAIAEDAAAKAKADADAKAKVELDAKYGAAIKKGDDAFAKKEWVIAKAGYTEAGGLKPAEQYPKTQLAAIDKTLGDEAAAKAKADADAKSKAELDAKYTAAIKKGDDAFGVKSWTNARVGYDEAVSLKPGEQYPKTQLAAIEKALADEAAAKSKAEADAKSKAELDAKYLAVIKSGDEAFAKRDWSTAKTSYNEAIGLKAAEPYPKMQLTAIDKAMGDEAAAKSKAEAEAKSKAELDAKYAAALKKGDEAFAAKNWAVAKDGYNEALGVKPAEAFPKTQIALIDKTIADEAAARAKADADAKAKAEQEAKYLAAIKKGDDAFGVKNWTNARVGYNEAVSLKPTEQYPKTKLAEIDKAVSEEKAKLEADAKAKAEAELNAKYTAALKKGDDAFATKDWSTAKSGYTEAGGLKPTEQYPKTQIAAIDKAIAEEAAAKAKADADVKSKAELEAKYLAAVKKGDDAYGVKSWAVARAGYTDASGLKPNEQYPKTQLTLIDKALADEAALKAKAEADAKSKAELDAKYSAAVKNGDDAFAKKDWTTARSAYTEASGFKASEPYPKMQLTAIDKAMGDEAAAKAKAEAEAKSKAELDAKYSAAVKKGDEAYAAKNMAVAKEGYNEALLVKPAEQYPKTQIALIDKTIADEAAARAKADADAKSKAEAEAKYLAAVKKGDDAFGVKSWTNARVGYNEAVSLKPLEQYPKTKLAEIDKAVAEEKAKLDADSKAKAEAELNAKYVAAVKKGDDAFGIKSWVVAKAGYSEAGALKPAEQYPKTQIALIDKTMAEEAAAKAKADAETKSKAEIDAKYLAAVKKGDDAYGVKSWAVAKAGYTEASALKSAENYPKTQLVLVEKAIADEAAAKAKADSDAKSKAELDAKYLTAVKTGDAAFARRDWTTARSAYTEASGFKASEPYPKMQLTAIDKAMGDEAAAKAKAEAAAKSKAELDAKYAAAVKKGDDAYAGKNLGVAKDGYNEALVIKPAEQYPKNQLALINKIISDEAAAKAKVEADAKAKADLDAKYLAAVKKGDDAFGVKNWTNARVGYNEAVSLKPLEQYPKTKLAEIDKAVSEEKAKMDADAKAKAEAELKAKYTAAVKKGDDASATKNWALAKVGYTEANTLKPTEPYPIAQLAIVNKAIADDAAAKAKSDADAKAKADLEAKYVAALKKGDAAFAKKDWVTSKVGYTEASGIKTAEEYPKTQLAAIDKALADEAEAKAKVIAAAKEKAELDAKYLAAIKSGDAAFAKRDWPTARGAYYLAIGFKGLEPYPKNQLTVIDKALAEERSKMDAAARAKIEAEMAAKYAAAIKKGDSNFGTKNYKDAKINYEEALTYKGSDAYAMGKLVEIDIFINAGNNENAAQRIKDLLAKYPKGVTEEIVNGNGCVIVQRVLVKGNMAWVYQKKIFNWGNTAYFRDATPIVESIFEAETKH